MLPERDDLRGLRIGYIWLDGVEGVEPGVRESYERSVETARSLGADEVAEVSSTPSRRTRWRPTTSSPRPRPRPTWPATTACATACGSTRRTSRMYEETRRAGFGAEVTRRVLIGAYALSAGYYDAFYGQAQACAR